MEDINSVGNVNVNTPVNPVMPPIIPPVEVKPTPKLKTIPKYLYFVIPSSLIIAGLLAYIFISGGLNTLVETDRVTGLIPEEEIQRNITPTATVTAIPTPTPTPHFIIKGLETYSISQGKTNGPKMTKAVIDPHDPSVGATQKFTLFVNHTIPVTFVKIKLTSDTKNQTHDLKLSAGTPLDGQWSGSWTIDDTHNQIYSFGIEVGDGTNTSKNIISIR